MNHFVSVIAESIVDYGKFRWRGELTRYMHSIAVARFGGSAGPHEHHAGDRARGRIRAGQRQPPGSDAEVDLGAAHIRWRIDRALHRHGAEIGRLVSNAPAVSIRSD